MEVKHENKKVITRFKSLVPGEVFSDINEECIFMKINRPSRTTYNSVRLMTGDLMTFNETTNVIPINGVYVINYKGEE